MKTKYCPYCKQILPILEFSKSKIRADNLQIYCKSCSAKINKKWRKSDKGIKYLTSEKYRQKQNKSSNNYYKTKAGKITAVKKTTKRRRQLDFIIIDTIPFPDTISLIYHHITNKYVIAIPEALHKLCYTNDRIEHRYKLNKILAVLLKPKGGDKNG